MQESQAIHRKESVNTLRQKKASKQIDHGEGKGEWGREAEQGKKQKAKRQYPEPKWKTHAAFVLLAAFCFSPLRSSCPIRPLFVLAQHLASAFHAAVHCCIPLLCLPPRLLCIIARRHHLMVTQRPPLFLLPSTHTDTLPRTQSPPHHAERWRASSAKTCQGLEAPQLVTRTRTRGRRRSSIASVRTNVPCAHDWTTRHQHQHQEQHHHQPNPQP